MEELDLAISLFVAPVFEAEEPGEPEAVEGGSWSSSEMTKWQWSWWALPAFKGTTYFIYTSPLLQSLSFELA